MLDIAELEKKKDWASLIKLYQNNDTDREIRWKVEKILIASKSDKLIELLITALQNEADDEWRVAGLLDYLGDVQAVEPLLSVLENSSRKRERIILKMLEKQAASSKNLEAFIKYLQNKDTDGHTRWQIAQILTASKSDKLIELLITAFHEETDDKWQIAQLLGELGDVRAVEPLLNGLESSSGWRKRTIIKALGQLGDARAVEPLLNALEYETKLEDVIATALAELADTSIVERLIEIIRNNSGAKLCSIIHLLADIGDERAVKPITEIFFTVEHGVSYQAIVEALMRFDVPEAISALKNHKKDTILQVEDSFECKRFVPRVIESLGYNCIEACSGQKGLDFAKKVYPCLILLDNDLFDMDVNHFINELESDETSKHIPIIILYAKDEPLDLTRYSSVVGFIQKPIGVSDLRREITRVLGENPIQYPL